MVTFSCYAAGGEGTRNRTLRRAIIARARYSAFRKTLSHEAAANTERRFRAADARALWASGLAQIGQFRRPQLRVAIAYGWQRWQREEQSVRQCWQAAPAVTKATPGCLTGGWAVATRWIG